MESQKKTLIPFLGYKPAREVIDQAREFIMDVAAKSGRTLTKGEADMHIEAMYKGVKAPREISDKIDPYFEVPDFFVKDSVLAKENVKHGTASVSDFVTHVFRLEEIQKAFDLVESKQDGVIKAAIRFD